MTAAKTKVNLDHAERLGVILHVHRRINILVGGRASTKSTFIADLVLANASKNLRICCSREYQNSIEESVHYMLKDEIERLGAPGFEVKRTEIDHASGGHIFYRGLARNIASLKGLNCHILWVEEGETLSDDTLRILTASIRVSAKEVAAAKREDRDAIVPTIYITMNRGSSKDAIAKRFLKRAETELAKCGYYIDDLVQIIEINHDENPWFHQSGLEQERADDERFLSPAAYRHKWGGEYSDTVENAIIEPEWFDNCVDAHELLGFKPEGIEVVSYDPTGTGKDPGALMKRHGSVFTFGEEYSQKDPNENCDKAMEYVARDKPDALVWDANGIGASLKRQITEALAGKKIEMYMFLSQSKVDSPDAIYDPGPIAVQKAKTNSELFHNRRAQRYWQLRDRAYRTYLAVRAVKEGTKVIFTNHDEMISFSSSMKVLPQLRAELCRIPQVPGRNKILIMSKDDMAKEGIESPNLADCCMMSMDVTGVKVRRRDEDRTFIGWGG